LERINCAYCGYANGLVNYVSVIVAETERLGNTIKLGAHYAMMNNSREVILVTDRTKFEKNATAQVGHLRDLSYLVTDRQPPAQACELIDEHNVSLIVPGHH